MPSCSKPDWASQSRRFASSIFCTLEQRNVPVSLKHGPNESSETSISHSCRPFHSRGVIQDTLSISDVKHTTTNACIK